MRDEDLVLNYIDGDESAFTEIIDRYMKPIYNFAFRICRNTDDAEEITQETFLKVWKNIKKFKTEQKFKTWIYAIAKNASIDFLRKRKNVLFSELENEDGVSFLDAIFFDDENVPDKLFESAEKKTKILSLIMTLPEKYRQVLILYYKENFSLSEIAEALNRPLNTVKSQLGRGIKLLSERIAPMNGFNTY